jgi:hypothetical protein
MFHPKQPAAELLVVPEFKELVKSNPFIPVLLFKHTCAEFSVDLSVALGAWEGGSYREGRGASRDS